MAPLSSTMRAAVREHYGLPDRIRTAEREIPSTGPTQVLIRVMAAGVNPGDWDLLRGLPYALRPSVGLRRPRNPVLGFAVAGRVEACGPDVTGLRVGDEVYAGIAGGGFAEYVAVPEEAVALKPASVTFVEAAAVPVTGTTALQALRDVAKVQPGQRVLVTGASGGVGTFAVQIAKARGGEVTGVCSAANAGLVRGLGADHVVAYDRDDFTRAGQEYDVVLDNVGAWPLGDLRRVVAPKGILIPNSNKGEARWLGGYLRRAVGALALSPFVSQRLRPFAATDDGADLDELTKLIETGEVRPVVDSVFSLESTAEALVHYGAGHVAGKVVIAVGADPTQHD